MKIVLFALAILALGMAQALPQPSTQAPPQPPTQGPPQPGDCQDLHVDCDTYLVKASIECERHHGSHCDRQSQCSMLNAIGWCDKTCKNCECKDGKGREYCLHKTQQDCFWDATMFEDCKLTCGYCTPRPTAPPQPPTQAPGPAPQPGTCGSPQVQTSRVVAGTTATRGSWPWQTLLFVTQEPNFWGKAICGGTLISNQWVVTTASCVAVSLNASSWTIRVGEHDRNSWEGSEQDIRVSRVVQHPGFNREAMNNNIAMFKLARPVKFNKYVQPACLPSEPASGRCYITGWGATSGRDEDGFPNTNMAMTLQQAALDVVDRRTCEEFNRRGGKEIEVTSAMVCAGDGGRSRKSACFGDVGGPFVCQNGGKWELHGAVSYGSGECDSSESYTVFANVFHFKDWIHEHMQS